MEKKILFIPLDDRPYTFQMPVRMAKIAGFQTVHPPREMLGRFLMPGDSDGILKWLDAIKGKFDAAIIALDMPLYGGLVASRRSEESINTVESRLKLLYSILRKHKERFGKIYLFNVLMRIAPTYVDESLLFVAQEIIQFSKESYLAERGDEHAKKALESLRKSIPEGYVNDYLDARKRNHEINKKVVELSGEDFIDFLIICADDSSTVGLNVLEREKLEKIILERDLQTKTLIVPGTDETACLLLARALVEITGFSASIMPIYSDPAGKKVTPRYEDRSYDEIVKLHIKAAGCMKALNRRMSDILFYLNVPPDVQKEAASQKERTQKVRLLDNFIISIKNSLRAGKCVSVADVYYANGADLMFMKKLIEEINFLYLCGFAAWNTAGNSVGTALSHAVVRWISEQIKTDTQDEKLSMMKAHMHLIIERLADDWIYQSEVRRKANIEAMLKQSSVFYLGKDSEYFCSLIGKWMRDRLMKLFSEKIADMELTHCSGKTIKIKMPEKIDVCLPWSRLFEIELDIDFPVVCSYNIPG